MAAQAATMPKPSPIKPVPPPLNSPERKTAQEQAKPVEAKVRKPVAAWRLKVGMAVPWVLVLFLTGLVIQVYLAGYGLSELGNQGMEAHLGFAHVIELLPLILVLVGFLGADKASGIGGIVLFVQFQLQYVFIAASQPYWRAMHPANGVLMVALTFGLLLLRVRMYPMNKARRMASSKDAVKA